MALTHATITKRLKNVVSTCKKTASSADETLFFKNFNDKWSIAENLIHLVKSVKGLSKAFAMPKEQLIVAFGKPNHPSISYKILFEKYKAFLAKGIIPSVAAATFAPQITEGDTLKSVVELFDLHHNNFIESLKYFTEEELDNYQIPHPALGNLTVREMLYFTIFHIEHHTHTIAKLVENKTLQAV